MPRWTQDDLKAFLKRRASAGVRLPPAEPERQDAPTLEQTVQGETKSAGRPVVRFIFHRQKLLDRDNAFAGVKDLLDGLRHASLIQGDTESEIDLQVEQVKVAHRKEQKTVVEIKYP